MRVTILTAASKFYWPLLEIGAPNKLEYCLRHNIQFSMAIHEPMSKPKWGERELFMLDSLNSFDSDWIWFMGADTLITNMTKDIRDFCDNEFDFICGVDINGINNDSILLRNNMASRNFLKRVLSNRNVPNDQVAMNTEMKSFVRTKLVSQREFNSFKYDEYNYGPYPDGNWQEGDLAIHFPGKDNERRKTLMTEFLSKVKR